ncbi:GPI-anchored protein LLG1-like [Andrographis paniculata]|uniref:GPI-anchored protein LLG1-like n=1 Tax=Andrographis paniculata TaxID=175694 RepID=UPI0021E978D7|nr:GPI-anchored protein LLG1-like [Andrographis paniculata]
MGLKRSSLHLFLLFLVVAFHLASSSSSHISCSHHISANSIIFVYHGNIGRSLLQQKTTCNVDFEHMNYTVITSQCKGPNYTPDRCCPPLKQLLCPYKDQVNDLKSNCADTFFSYVNLYGKYPPGLFASLCKDREEGLSCDGVDAQSNPQATASSAVPVISPTSSSLYTFVVGLPLLLAIYM